MKEFVLKLGTTKRVKISAQREEGILQREEREYFKSCGGMRNEMEINRKRIFSDKSEEQKL